MRGARVQAVVDELVRWVKSGERTVDFAVRSAITRRPWD